MRQRIRPPAPSSAVEAVKAYAEAASSMLRAESIPPDIIGMYPDKPTTGVFAAIKARLMPQRYGVTGPRPQYAHAIPNAQPPTALLGDGRLVTYEPTTTRTRHGDGPLVPLAHFRSIVQIVEPCGPDESPTAPPDAATVQLEPQAAMTLLHRVMQPIDFLQQPES
jgi:hypothetical protein